MYREPILRELWHDLDSVVYRLMTDGDPKQVMELLSAPADQQEALAERLQEEWQSYGEDVGRARGLAYAIAVIRNPSDPDVNWVREEAMRRWEESIE